MKDEIGFLQTVASVTQCPDTLAATRDRTLSLHKVTTCRHHKDWLKAVISECETRARILDVKFAKSCEETDRILEACTIGTFSQETKEYFELNDDNDAQRLGH